MNQTTVRLDFRLVSAVLLVVIAVMLAIWQPWTGSNKETITARGEATVKAAPDQFTFFPVYQKEAKTSAQAISDVSTVGNGVVTKLKELGVREADLKTSVSTNPGYDLRTGQPNDLTTAQFSLTATVNDQALAQKVLDYLVTTSPLYGVSPQSTFSKDKEKQLETDARAKAVADAKAKAAQTAGELEVRVGRVVSVSEPEWGGPVMPFAVAEKALDARSSAPTTTSPVLLTGEQEVTYLVTVVFSIR